MPRNVSLLVGLKIKQQILLQLIFTIILEALSLVDKNVRPATPARWGLDQSSCESQTFQLAAEKDCETFKKIYTTNIWPKLEYAFAVWSPHLRMQSTKISYVTIAVLYVLKDRTKSFDIIYFNKQIIFSITSKNNSGGSDFKRYKKYTHTKKKSINHTETKLHIWNSVEPAGNDTYWLYSWMLEEVQRMQRALCQNWMELRTEEGSSRPAYIGGKEEERYDSHMYIPRDWLYVETDQLSEVIGI